MRIITLLILLNMITWGFVGTASAMENRKMICRYMDGTEFLHIGSMCPMGSTYVRAVF